MQPLALVEYEGRWHVFGVDLDVDAERTFLLSRIVGDVDASRARASTPRCATARASARWRDWRTSRARNTALLEVNPGTEAALRLARRALPAEQGIRVPFVDIHVFADELASYGPEVRVVEPAELRDQVIARLDAARAAHGGRRMSARKPLIATDRAALMLQLVPYLIGKGEVSIAEAADEFDVTPIRCARWSRSSR